MNLHTLRQTPDPKLLASDHQRALWYDLKGDWDTAHSIVQVMSDVNAMWIHAYLHRKEGDLGNASYWYRNAGRSMPEISLEEEWEYIAQALIKKG